MTNSEQQIAEFLAAFDPEIGALAQKLRKFLRKQTEPTMELVGDSTISVNIGYGFSPKAWDCYVAIIVYSKHINLSFPYGASLADPEGLLQGTGARIRHIRVDALKDAQAPDVIDLLADARDIALAAADPASKNKAGVTTMIKEIKGKKRRPAK